MNLTLLLFIVVFLLGAFIGMILGASLETEFLTELSDEEIINRINKKRDTLSK